MYFKLIVFTRGELLFYEKHSWILVKLTIVIYHLMTEICRDSHIILIAWANSTTRILEKLHKLRQFTLTDENNDIGWKMSSVIVGWHLSMWHESRYTVVFWELWFYQCWNTLQGQSCGSARALSLVCGSCPLNTAETVQKSCYIHTAEMGRFKLKLLLCAVRLTGVYNALV